MNRFRLKRDFRPWQAALIVLAVVLSAAQVMGAGPGNWRSVGIGDCPGRDVAGSSGPNPDPAKCNDAFQGQTAVCWDRGCTYKNIAVDSCRGGANPGRMYVCEGRPAQPASVGNWQSVGIGDCPGRDVAGSSGPNPDPTKCNDAFQGQTAVCWDKGCTYKNIATDTCRGGANPGRMYTCAAPGRMKGPKPSPDRVLFDNWNGYVCSTTNRARFELRRDSFVSRIVVWSDARRDGGNLSAILNGPRGAASIASRRGPCDPNQGQWCERIFDVSRELPAGSYSLDLDRNSVCQNSASRENGFAKVYGHQR